MNILQVEKIFFSANNRLPKLENISFSVAEKEIVFLAGKSGEGKTTLLKIVFGQLQQQQGTIVFNGTAVETSSKSAVIGLRKQIGFLPKDNILLEDRTVSQNISFFLSLYGYKTKEVKQKILPILLKVGLSEHLNSKMNDLSVFEKQKLSLAVAIAHSPVLLLVDEPTENLDPEQALKIIELLKAVNRDGTAIIWTTHNYDVLKKVHGRVYLLENRQLKEVPVKSH